MGTVRRQVPHGQPDEKRDELSPAFVPLSGVSVSSITKIGQDGQYQPFPGVTIVWLLADRNTAGWSELPDIIGRLTQGKYIPLPADSYHITLLDIITMAKALGERGSTQTWLEYLEARTDRLLSCQSLLEAAEDAPAFRPSLCLTSVRVYKSVITAEFELTNPSDELRAAQLDAELVETLGLRRGRVHRFHLTLAYVCPGRDDTEVEGPTMERVAEAVRACVAGAPLRLDPPHVSEFKDMLDFPKWEARGREMHQGST